MAWDFTGGLLSGNESTQAPQAFSAPKKNKTWDFTGGLMSQGETTPAPKPAKSPKIGMGDLRANDVVTPTPDQSSSQSPADVDVNPDFAANYPRLNKFLATVTSPLKSVFENPWVERAGQTGSEVMTMQDRPDKVSTGSKVGDVSADIMGNIMGFVENPASAGSKIWRGAEGAIENALPLVPKLNKLPEILQTGAKLGATTIPYEATMAAANNRQLSPKEAATSALANAILGMGLHGAGRLLEGRRPIEETTSPTETPAEVQNPATSLAQTIKSFTTKTPDYQIDNAPGFEAGKGFSSVPDRYLESPPRSGGEVVTQRQFTPEEKASVNDQLYRSLTGADSLKTPERNFSSLVGEKLPPQSFERPGYQGKGIDIADRLKAVTTEPIKAPEVAAEVKTESAPIETAAPDKQLAAKLRSVFERAYTPPADTGNIDMRPAEIPAAMEAQKATPTDKQDLMYMHAGVPLGLKEFAEQDIKPAVNAFFGGAADTAERVKNLVSPRSGVSEEGLGAVYKMIGEQNRLNAVMGLDKTITSTDKMFEKMPESDRVGFIDRIKTGQQQPTPELQAVADFMRKWEDAEYQEVMKYNPSLPYLDNHFRVFWKEIPGQQTSRGFLGLGRRPLEGTKGFTKKATLADISEGIAKGGKPISTNPITLFKMARADAMKFISAQRMWNTLKQEGLVQLVSGKNPAPEGYVKLNDKIAQVYFPAPATTPNAYKIVKALAKKTGIEKAQDIATSLTPEDLAKKKTKALIKGGEWYVEKNAARLLNNHLSKDYIRAVAAGRGLLKIKNNTTAMELALSPFHAIFESVEAIGSNIGLSYARIFNQGILQGNPKNAAKGLADLIKSPLAPIDLAKLGGKAIKYISSPDEFINSTGAQSFLKQFPDAQQLIEDLFYRAGGKLQMHEDYKINAINGLKNTLKTGNIPGALIRALPAFNETIMKPLFESYIPRLKVGLFLKEYSQQLEQHSDSLVSGKTARGKLARETWDRVENRFGEMNFDTLFWNRTFKTALQVMFRSVTWKLGNIRGFGNALTGQAREFAEPFKFARDSAGKLTYAGRAPQLDPGMAWALGMLTTTVAMSTIAMNALTGHGPSQLYDYFFPRTGERDKNGNPIRISIPTYFKDLLSFMKGPKDYLTHSFSGVFGKTIDALQNKDFYGNFIYDPSSPVLKQLVDSIAYITPKPFSFTQYQNLAKSKANPETRLLAALGFVQAPKEYSQSDFSKALTKAYQSARPHVPLTTEQQATNKQKQDLKNKIQSGTATSQDLADAIRQGLVKEKGLKTFEKNAQLNTMQLMWKYLSADQRTKLLPLASPEERNMLLEVDSQRKSTGTTSSSSKSSWKWKQKKGG